MTSRMRVDRLLVERGLFESRAQAQAAIAAGGVTADGVPVRKPSDRLAIEAELRTEAAHPYVMSARRPAASLTCCSRAGLPASMRSTSAAGRCTRACARETRSLPLKARISARPLRT